MMLFTAALETHWYVSRTPRQTYVQCIILIIINYYFYYYYYTYFTYNNCHWYNSSYPAWQL